MSEDNKYFMEDRDTWWSLHEDTRGSLESIRLWLLEDIQKHGGPGALYGRSEIYDKKLDRLLTFVIMVNLPEDKVTLVNE
jgi:hypothetical protein